MADDLRTDLDYSLFQTRQRQILDWLGRREGSEEIAEIVGERVKLETDGVGGERAARQPRPPDRALALFDPLFARAALIVFPRVPRAAGLCAKPAPVLSGRGRCA